MTNTSGRPGRLVRVLLNIELSIGNLFLAMAIVIGAVPTIFALGYAFDHSDGSNPREARMVLAVIAGVVILGLALRLDAQRRIKRLGNTDRVTGSRV